MAFWSGPHDRWSFIEYIFKACFALQDGGTTKINVPAGTLPCHHAQRFIMVTRRTPLIPATISLSWRLSYGFIQQSWNVYLRGSTSPALDGAGDYAEMYCQWPCRTILSVPRSVGSVSQPVVDLHGGVQSSASYILPSIVLMVLMVSLPLKEVWQLIRCLLIR